MTTTTTTSLFQREFPGFQMPAAILDRLAKGVLVDQSYHHDVCPSFTHCLVSIDNGEVHDLRIFVHPERPEDREGDYPRYNVYLGGAHEVVLITTDDLDAALATLNTAAAVLASLRTHGHIE